jgi:hypothetical protein
MLEQVIVYALFYLMITPRKPIIGNLAWLVASKCRGAQKEQFQEVDWTSIGSKHTSAVAKLVYWQRVRVGVITNFTSKSEKYLCYAQTW